MCLYKFIYIYMRFSQFIFTLLLLCTVQRYFFCQFVFTCILNAIYRSKEKRSTNAICWFILFSTSILPHCLILSISLFIFFIWMYTKKWMEIATFPSKIHSYNRIMRMCFISIHIIQMEVRQITLLHMFVFLYLV